MRNSLYSLKRFVFLLLLTTFVLPSVAAEKTSFNLGHSNGLAMDGYDVMSYWRGGNPKKGNEQFKFEYGNATWVFASQQHLDAFSSDPEKYAPQFGGHCAYAASRGYLADVDPFAWRIWKDRLYLNFSPGVQRLWAGTIDKNIKSGDANWPQIDPALAAGASD